MFQDVPFEVEAGSGLNKLQAAGSQAEDGPLGDVVDGLPPVLATLRHLFGKKSETNTTDHAAF